MSKMVAFVVFGIVLGVFVALAATAVGVSFPFLAAVGGLLVTVGAIGAAVVLLNGW